MDHITPYERGHAETLLDQARFFDHNATMQGAQVAGAVLRGMAQIVRVQEDFVAELREIRKLLIENQKHVHRR